MWKYYCIRVINKNKHYCYKNKRKYSTEFKSERCKCICLAEIFSFKCNWLPTILIIYDTPQLDSPHDPFSVQYGFVVCLSEGRLQVIYLKNIKDT